MAKLELSGIPTAPDAPVVVGVPQRGHLPVGRVLAGRYEIRDRLGAGGMGAVYRAHDRELREDVALKVILTAHGELRTAELQVAATESTARARRAMQHDESAIERLRREVKLARRITHPNVCRVFDLGESDGLYFLTMELIDGRTLREMLAAGPLPLAQLAQALPRRAYKI